MWLYTDGASFVVFVLASVSRGGAFSMQEGERGVMAVSLVFSFWSRLNECKAGEPRKKEREQES